jgi:hypothetical protein
MQRSHEFAELGRELHGPSDDQAAVQRIVQLSVKHVEPCTGASTTKSAADTASLTTSDPVAAQADTLQYDLNKGPCLRSAKRDTNYLLFDVAGDTRWPRFCRPCSSTPLPQRAVLASGSRRRRCAEPVRRSARCIR